MRAFAATDEVSVVHSSAGWQLLSVLVDHHPIEPAVGYLVDRDGARVAVSGDTAVGDGMRALVAGGIDVLVHEALLSSRVRPALLSWNASAHAVGELATRDRPGTLVLTHLLPAPRSAEDERLYLHEVYQGGFDGQTVVAHDGLRLTITPS